MTKTAILADIHLLARYLIIGYWKLDIGQFKYTIL